MFSLCNLCSYSLVLVVPSWHIPLCHFGTMEDANLASWMCHLQQQWKTNCPSSPVFPHCAILALWMCHLHQRPQTLDFPHCANLASWMCHQQGLPPARDFLRQEPVSRFQLERCNTGSVLRLSLIQLIISPLFHRRRCGRHRFCLHLCQKLVVHGVPLRAVKSFAVVVCRENQSMPLQ